MFSKYEDILNDCTYPIFINWDSGPFETYADHLFRIRQGEITSTAPLTSPIYLITDLAKIIVNAPKAWTVVGSNSISSTIGNNYTALSSDIELYNRKKREPKVQFTANEEEFSNFNRSVWWILTSPVKVVSTPITYTLAKPAWEMMLRRTNTPFYSPKDFTPINDFQDGTTQSSESQGGKSSIPEDSESNINNGKGVLIKFISHLSTHIKNKYNNTDNTVNVTVIGHSMGAIIVNKLILTEHNLPIKNIVHLASADSIENLFLSVVPYLRKNSNTYFYSLSLHPDNENREVSAWGLTPSGSLLVWVDEMYTNPETILNKRSGRWDKMEKTLHLIPDSVESRMFFKVYGITKENSTYKFINAPQKHGEFGDTAFWRKETWWNPTDIKQKKLEEGK